MTKELPLLKNTIHLWFAFPHEIKDSELLKQYHGLLTEHEREKQQQFFFERHRHQYLVTRAMLRTVLSQYADVKPNDWMFTKNQYGKPSIAKSHGLSHLQFNISHTDKLIVCAVLMDNEIGVDVEYTLRPGETIAVADRFFSKKEVDDLMVLPEEDQRSRFFDYWTLKEAYIKACGMGLTIPLNDFSFDLQKQSTISISFSEQRNDNPELWKFWLFQSSRAHKTAVGLKCMDSQLPIEVIQYKTVPLKEFNQVDYPLLRQTELV